MQKYFRTNLSKKFHRLGNNKNMTFGILFYTTNLIFKLLSYR